LPQKTARFVFLNRHVLISHGQTQNNPQEIVIPTSQKGRIKVTENDREELLVNVLLQHVRKFMTFGVVQYGDFGPKW
jgi:hypothetical protein